MDVEPSRINIDDKPINRSSIVGQDFDRMSRKSLEIPEFLGLSRNWLQLWRQLGLNRYASADLRLSVSNKSGCSFLHRDATSRKSDASEQHIEHQSGPG